VFGGCDCDAVKDAQIYEHEEVNSDETVFFFSSLVGPVSEARVSNALCFEVGGSMIRLWCERN